MGIAPHRPRLIGTAPGSRIWLSTDCCGLSMAVITWFLVLWACSTVNGIVTVWLPSSTHGVALRCVFLGIGALALLSHTKAMLTDPGAVPPGAAPMCEEDKQPGQWAPYRRYCRVCDCYKPPRAHHDSQTGRCVVKMDHFCPWVNNCVGIRNHKLFILFLVYVFLMSMMALVIVFLRTSSCVSERPTAAPTLPAPPTPPPPPSGRRRRRARSAEDAVFVRTIEALFDSQQCGLGMSAFFLILEAVLFGLFTFAMLCDQSEVLRTGVAAIDRLKASKGLAVAQVDEAPKVDEVFGGLLGSGGSRRWRLRCLWPSPPDFGDHHDTVMGFTLPRTGESAV
eukprot:TRINITY_DN2115_c0_g1_i1.p1 TRINITY_DN2115_c0_g1~~TRINITY_DN2115_c0_g1_i1.p1  ORF type:complete len:394 (+),score=67.85 TRINITY_DN2115_c0_g1_i1:173-1183(+)